MLRVAIYYENRLGRNDGNPLYILHELKRREKLGELTVDHLIPDGNYKHFGKYDIHIVVDWGEDGLTGLLPYKVDYDFGPGVRIYWASDTHLGFDYRIHTARNFDLAFVAQKDAVAGFASAGVSATWLPHAVEPRAYNDAADTTGTKPYEFLAKKYDVCFIGHVNSPNRVDALDRVFREFPNFFYGQKLFNQAAQKYAESKIVFNIAMKNDVNMRCFEALGSKSFLLTDRIQSIEELFEDGKHLVLYDNLDDMVEKARYYISHDDERRKIAEEGYRHVIAHHTFKQRVDVMLERAKELIKQGGSQCPATSLV